MILGAVLVVLALSLFLRNQRDAEHAQSASQEAIDQIWPVVEQRARNRVSFGSGDTLQDDPVSTQASESADIGDAAVSGGGMPTVEIDGRYYVGVLSIKALGLELPVLADLTEEALEIAPCRYSGAVSTSDLVIGAHNYVTHFAKIWRLQDGTEIIFTDMDGHTYYYEVAMVETISPSSNEYLIAGDYPLTLFTCTYAGNNRTAVRCIESE